MISIGISYGIDTAEILRQVGRCAILHRSRKGTFYNSKHFVAEHQAAGRRAGREPFRPNREESVSDRCRERFSGLRAQGARGGGIWRAAPERNATRMHGEGENRSDIQPVPVAEPLRAEFHAGLSRGRAFHRVLPFGAGTGGADQLQQAGFASLPTSTIRWRCASVSRWQT